MNDLLLMYARSVQTMRGLQSSYFTAAALARRTKRPENFEAADQLLKQTKAEELKVDKLTTEILNNGKANG